MSRPKTYGIDGKINESMGVRFRTKGRTYTFHVFRIEKIGKIYISDGMIYRKKGSNPKSITKKQAAELYRKLVEEFIHNR